MRKHYVLPVIHFLSEELAIEQAHLAFRCGADGVFLISHQGQDEDLFAPAAKIKWQYLDKLVGLNLLGSTADVALDRVFDAGLDMVWVDNAGVTSAGCDQMAVDISFKLAALSGNPENDVPKFFGSVAFKYQAAEPNPGLAASQAAMLGMIPTTSGAATGSAPDVGKIALMRNALGDYSPLAIASGMTPENVSKFKPYVTHFLVATGVSDDMHHLNESRLLEFVLVVKGSGGGRD